MLLACSDKKGIPPYILWINVIGDAISNESTVKGILVNGMWASIPEYVALHVVGHNESVRPGLPFRP